jgi:prevent-host-death family protein
MASITAFEAKTRFGELLDRVAKGEEIIITRHERPVARIVPEGGQSLDQVKRAVEGLKALQKDVAAFNAGKPQLSWEDFKSIVEEGRK